MGLHKIKNAETDLRYLLNQGYRKKGALKFVGDNYQLNLDERNYLHRKVYSFQKARSRAPKLINIADLENQILVIDGYNVLITLESVLYKPISLVESDDGVLRDKNAIFGKYKSNKNTKESLSFLIDFLIQKRPKKVYFLYDSQVSHSGELSAATNDLIKDKGLNASSETSKRVDSDIINLADEWQAIVSSSDGIIIDKVERVLDLPAAIYNELK